MLHLTFHFVLSIFYVAEERPTLLEMTQNTTGTSGVSLYSRKILVQHNTENLLPKWLRFLRGAVDSEDIPLNLSRELLQNSALIRSVRNNHFTDVRHHVMLDIKYLMSLLSQLCGTGSLWVNVMSVVGSCVKPSRVE